MCGKSAQSWNTMPTRRRSGGTCRPEPATTRPPMRTSPPSSRSRPAMLRSSVVLPQPLGPSGDTTRPGSTRRSTSRRTSWSPNCLRAALTTMLWGNATAPAVWSAERSTSICPDTFAGDPPARSRPGSPLRPPSAGRSRRITARGPRRAGGRRDPPPPPLGGGARPVLPVAHHPSRRRHPAPAHPRRGCRRRLLRRRAEPGDGGRGRDRLLGRQLPQRGPGRRPAARRGPHGRGAVGHLRPRPAARRPRAHRRRCRVPRPLGAAPPRRGRARRGERPGLPAAVLVARRGPRPPAPLLPRPPAGAARPPPRCRRARRPVRLARARAGRRGRAGAAGRAAPVARHRRLARWPRAHPGGQRGAGRRRRGRPVAGPPGRRRPGPVDLGGVPAPRPRRHRLVMGEACTLVVPCFNEERRLDPARLDRLAEAAGARVLLVDDGSTDGTRALLQRLATSAPDRFGVLGLDANRGKGEAVRRGLLAALDQGAGVVGYCDADFATPPEEVARLVAALRDDPTVDAVLGSRVALLGADIRRSAARHYSGRLFAT